MKTVLGQFVDIENRKIFSAEVSIIDEEIASVKEVNHNVQTYILPGFVDAHIHIESSMLVPSEFARLAVLHGNFGVS